MKAGLFIIFAINVYIASHVFFKSIVLFFKSGLDINAFGKI